MLLLRLTHIVDPETVQRFEAIEEIVDEILLVLGNGRVLTLGALYQAVLQKVQRKNSDFWCTVMSSLR